MGFMDQQGQFKEFDITVLTPGFQVEGTLQVMGQVQTFLNDETKPVFALQNATLYGLQQGNPARSVQVSEVFLRKRSCHALLFSEMIDRDQSGLLPRAEPLAAYTDYYVIQGGFHMGMDSLLADYFEVSRGIFMGATDVSIFPLFTPQAALVQQAPLVYVSRFLVHTHHPV